MTQKWLTAALTGMLLCSSLALAQANPDDAKKRLIEQKIKLLDMLLNAPAAKTAATRDAESELLVEQGRSAVDVARKALADQRLDEASKSLDEGMKSVSKATRKMQSESALSESAQRKTYDEQTEQVATYRASLADMVKDPKNGDAAKALLNRLDTLSAEAKQQAAGGRLGDANRRLAEAYKLATEEIARLRQGQVVEMTLKFETPADEYAYEVKRFNSNQIMVDMLINEGKAEGERRKMVDGMVTEANRLRVAAEQIAAKGQHKEAMAQMEKANDQMKRAQQVMGIMVF